MKYIPANILIRKLLLCPVTKQNPLTSLIGVRAKVTFISRRFDFAFMFFTSCSDPIIKEYITDFQWFDHDRFVYDEMRNRHITDYAQMKDLDDLESAWMDIGLPQRFWRLCFSDIDLDVQDQLNIVAKKYEITDEYIKIKICNETPDPS